MDTSSPAAPDHAGVVVPPPLIYLACFLVGLGLQQLVALPRLPAAPWRLVGVALLAFWLALTVASFRRFRTARTSVIPVRPATALVIEGPYRFTRNPMYLGLLSLYVGVACWLGLLWPVLLAPVLVGVVQRSVIQREERYLERRFGGDYRQYRAQVRRWL